ncbi:DUF2283 domain-containing protein [bacterium SGD-2]|nr:DUF2283 domain-containing protein [bacterium SGD-2]
MNTHDKIELPPLPEARIVSYQTDSTMRRMELRTHSDEDMRDYARAAIEADRKRRNERVSLMREAAMHLTNWLDMVECDCEGPGHQCGRTQVKSCRDRLLAAAPQPAEPVKSTCKKCNGTGVESTRFHGVWPNGEECLEPIKCDQCDGFGTASAAEPVKSHLIVFYDDKVDCLYVDCNNSDEPIDAEEDDKGILYRRAISDGRLVGITIMNFMGQYAKWSDDVQRPAEPVKVPSDAQRWQKASALPRSWWRDAFNRIAAEGVTLDDLIDVETRRKLP